MITIFDFDGTLYKKDSFLTFSPRAIGIKNYFGALFLWSPNWFLWKLKHLSNSKAKERLYSRIFKGRLRSDMEEKAKVFAEHIDNNLRPGIWHRFLEACEREDEVIILTASSPLWIEPWLNNVRKRLEEQWQKPVDISLIGTEVESDADGRLTGKFATPNCHGYEKLRRLKEHLRERHPDLHPVSLTALDLTVYTDSNSDLPLLSIARYPHLV